MDDYLGLSLFRLLELSHREASSCSLNCSSTSDGRTCGISESNIAEMMSSTTLKPTFTGPRVPVAKSGRVAPSRAAILRVGGGPYDEELISTAVRASGFLCLQFGWATARRGV